MIKFRHLKSSVSKRFFTFCYSLVKEEGNRYALNNEKDNKSLYYQFTIFNPSPGNKSWNRRTGISLAFHRFNEHCYKINVSELEVFHSCDLFTYLILRDILNYFSETMQDIQEETGNILSPFLLKQIRKELEIFMLEYEEKTQVQMMQRLNKWCFLQSPNN